LNLCEYQEYPMFCPNCGHLNIGYKNKDGKIKYHCKRCDTSIVRTQKSRRKEFIEIFAPVGQVNITR